MARDSLGKRIERLGEERLGHHPFDLLQVLVVLILGLGVWQAFFAAPGLGRELARARDSSLVELGDLATAQPGQDAVLGGRLGVAAGVPPAPDRAAAAYGLVIYERQRWACEEKRDGSYQGRWRWSADFAPDAITLGSRDLAVRLDRPAHMTGVRFETPDLMWGDGPWCDGRWQDSIRLVGYREGDAVCLFGRKEPGTRLLVERLHGGDCESFLAYLARVARSARAVGWILLGVGLAVEGVWLVVRLPARLARRRKQ